jgi:hypothetical protein
MEGQAELDKPTTNSPIESKNLNKQIFLDALKAELDKVQAWSPNIVEIWLPMKDIRLSKGQTTFNQDGLKDRIRDLTERKFPLLWKATPPSGLKENQGRGYNHFVGVLGAELRKVKVSDSEGLYKAVSATMIKYFTSVYKALAKTNSLGSGDDVVTTANVNEVSI